MSTLFTVDQMKQLADDLERAGFFSEDVTTLRQQKTLKGILNVLHGLATIVRENKGVLDVLHGLATIAREDFEIACDKPFNPFNLFGSALPRLERSS
ncbi:MAG: hypothetical protein Q8Q23_02080 [bacterium]|nr:hypothetical protein [bacterium]